MYTMDNDHDDGTLLRGEDLVELHDRPQSPASTSATAVEAPTASVAVTSMSRPRRFLMRRFETRLLRAADANFVTVYRNRGAERSAHMTFNLAGPDALVDRVVSTAAARQIGRVAAVKGSPQTDSHHALEQHVHPLESSGLVSHEGLLALRNAFRENRDITVTFDHDHRFLSYEYGPADPPAIAARKLEEECGRRGIAAEVTCNAPINRSRGMIHADLSGNARTVAALLMQYVIPRFDLWTTSNTVQWVPARLD